MVISLNHKHWPNVVPIIIIWCKYYLLQWVNGYFNFEHNYTTLLTCSDIFRVTCLEYQNQILCHHLVKVNFCFKDTLHIYIKSSISRKNALSTIKVNCFKFNTIVNLLVLILYLYLKWREWSSESTHRCVLSPPGNLVQCR